MKWYFLNLSIAFDQLLAAMIGGFCDETLSSLAYRMERQGKPWGRFWRPAIDALFFAFGQTDHCRKAYEEERFRRQLPPELR